MHRFNAGVPILQVMSQICLVDGPDQPGKFGFKCGKVRWKNVTEVMSNFVSAKIIWWSHAKYRFFLAYGTPQPKFFSHMSQWIWEGAETTISFCLSSVMGGVGLIEIVQFVGS